ncbi:OLC1v1023905C1 [Oldenlandia corymbosa var. corymbosa]|uniref:OLC1v1023905C1 n=1 Tax=Oldenlandia corymbosa var. corymbosa TaxID=529605 RepID=A0AAV1C2G7_OLDCO|nr:OLC1v1023905C1 [Oldenlandia corymbosa var. corymbosa]
MADRNNKGDAGEQRERRTFEDDGRFQRNPDDDHEQRETRRQFRDEDRFRQEEDLANLDVRAAYGMVEHIEKQRSVQLIYTSSHDHSAMMTQGSMITASPGTHAQQGTSVPGSNKGPKKFGGMKNMAHMANTPLELISLNNSSNVRYNGSGSMIVPSTASMGYNGYAGSGAKMIPPQHQGPENLQAIMLSLNYQQQEMSRIANVKGVQTDSSGQLVNFAHYADFVGKNYDLILGTVDMIKPGSWFMDSGATGFMTNDLELLNSYNPVSHTTPVYLPDGSVKYVKHIGDVTFQIP